MKVTYWFLSELTGEMHESTAYLRESTTDTDDTRSGMDKYTDDEVRVRWSYARQRWELMPYG